MIRTPIHRPRLAAALGLVGSLGLACGPDPEPFDPDFSAVDAEVERFGAETMDVEGVTVVVVDREHGILHTVDVGDLSHDDEELVTSSGMLVATMVVLGLVDEGRLELDAPLASAVPWAGAHPQVTLAHLLSHTSGLPGMSSHGFNYPAYACEWDPATTLGACAQELFTADLGEDLRPPGEVFQWGGGVWQVVGAAAEELTGQPWAELVRERVGEPCDVPSLRFVMPPFDPSAFDGNAAALPGADNPSISLGAVSTAEDFATLLVALLQDGRCGDRSVVSPSMIEQMRIDRASGLEAGEPYGLGWSTGYDGDGRSHYLAQGLFGTTAWIDEDFDHGVFIGLQTQSQDGTNLAALIRPLVQEALDDARAR